MQYQELNLSQENENSLSKDESKFILEQAEKTLKEIADSSQAIVSRTTTLITIVSGLLALALGVFVKRLETSGMDLLAFSCIPTIIYLFTICCLLIQNIQGQDYYAIGRDPKLIINDDFFKAKDENERLLWLIKSEIHSYEIRISFNRGKNDRRWNKLNIYMWLITAIPIVFLIVYLPFSYLMAHPFLLF